MSSPPYHSYPTPAYTPPNDSAIPLTVLASSRAVIYDQDNNLTVSPATITISPQTGTIISILPTILPPSSFPAHTVYIDHSPKLLLPGLVDAHVHLNEPGRTEWEGFNTGTRAAASGGVTTVVDMPLNAIPPTTTVQGLKEKIAAAQGQCWVDVGFYGGIIPGNASELLPLVEAGVRGFKGFLIESGVDEFPAVSSEDVALAMTTLSKTPTTLMFHAEMIPPITDSVGDDVQTSLPPLQPTGPLNSYNTFLDSRPPAFETYAIEEILSLSYLAPELQLHIVHLSAVEAVPILRAAKERGVKITAETCFHYLALASEEVEDGDTRHKCCPPIRSSSNRDGLWSELSSEDSVIQTVVSDHSPCTPELKLLPEHLGKGCCAGTKGVNGEILSKEEAEEKERGDFFASWGGISSVGLGLPILWTEATSRSLSSSITILDVVRLCAVNTSKQVGLSHKKGAIRPGMDADICVFDDEASWVVGREQMLFRNKVSPYQGRTMRGLVKETWVRGQKVFQRDGPNGGFVGKQGLPVGKLLLEKRKI
ncbi:probable allantoinase, mitochondrial precursor [Phialocephala subalpina]|uniref:allantoinase n=1 Tax=Phialocephala subalpina TaxID=576137 RepID=A0A1L7X027_9HELO|nr:probable allantoinase, mitochondrial precursor [Phialocephala subalpina]